MTDLLETVARLRAYEAGRAQLYASHRHLALRDDALLFCPLTMAGEDTTVHIVAIGEVGRRPRILCVPDPRFRDDQYWLFARLADFFVPYFQQCLDNQTYPQIWVSSGVGASLVDVLADRLRYNSHHGRVKELGELLTYLAQRYPINGQQALHAATEALRLHWVTGQQEGEDEHLAALLTWIQPPQGLPLYDAIERAETIPSGVKTDPTLDRDTLAPLVMQYNNARRRSASKTELHARGKLIYAALLPVVREIYKNTRRAYLLLQRSGLPPLPSLTDFESREAQEYASFMRQRALGYHIPLRDPLRVATHGLVTREDSVSIMEAVLQREDAVQRARGRLDGHIVTGEVITSQRARIGTRKNQYRFQIRSSQRVLRVRPRDTFYWVDDSRLVVEVVEAKRQQGVTIVTFLIIEGMRCVGLPEAGTTIELMPSKPDWDKLMRERVHLKTRLHTIPWTHQAGGIPSAAPPSITVPADPLLLVEALQ
jgi:hypothetical protein